ncbi:nuclear transport factor 2 family protein [Thalassotalea sp. HSM 43]|uniref:nuclear transport factor 2 family protein n=1 Tax=Thalassotalea sp. HSM 43 TaxID=2552945 RepID=UPI00108022AD|nr:nuclear transport factor 2 family protein [Thalassotalea sp. HSM 43]QBY04357.1 nuclear transport factor 2 family protein [Thalassotalea sp. HSM 43]
MRKLLIVLLCLPLFSNASPLTTVEQFVSLSDATKVKGASQADIDAVAALLTDDMRYQHPNYGADLSKADFIAGLVNYMGMADSLTSNITNKIVGDNAITIAFVSTTVMDGKQEVDGKPLMRLFEFKDGKISLIREYW